MAAKFAAALVASLVLIWTGSVAASAAGVVPTAPVYYTVRPGDSLSSIAKAQFGDATKWRELYQLNRSVVGNDPSHLVVGEVLTLVKGTGRPRRASALAGPQPSRSVAVVVDGQAAAHIKHVFVIMQENHTFDNYFGTYPGVDGLNAGLNVPVKTGDKEGNVEVT